MVQWVVEALRRSRYVDQMVVVGLAEPSLKGVVALPDRGSIVTNCAAGISWLQKNRPGAEHVLCSGADIPLVTAESIDSFVESCRPFDQLAYYGVVRRSVMEARFPSSRRTYVRLRTLELAGGELVLFDKAILSADWETWEMITDARKHAWKVARLVGPLTLFRLLLRRLTLSEAEAVASRLLGGPARAVFCPHPELAMDVDKPYQLQVARTLLE